MPCRPSSAVHGGPHPNPNPNPSFNPNPNPSPNPNPDPNPNPTLTRYGDAETGEIPATFQMIFLTGWAPHESMQKPMSPGSVREVVRA